jgi:hypothetical protein
MAQSNLNFLIRNFGAQFYRKIFFNIKYSLNSIIFALELMILEPNESDNHITSIDLYQEEEKFFNKKKNSLNNRIFKPSYSPKIIKINETAKPTNNTPVINDKFTNNSNNSFLKYKRKKRNFLELNKTSGNSESQQDPISLMNIAVKKFKYLSLEENCEK